MRIIKEFCKTDNGYRVILRSDTYMKTLEYVTILVTYARRDFSLNDSEIEIVKYGGQRYAKTTGIEFDTKTKPPAEYQEIEQLEFTIA